MGPGNLNCHVYYTRDNFWSSGFSFSGLQKSNIEVGWDVDQHWSTHVFAWDRHASFITIGKRQVFCVGDRLKMDRHKALASTIVTPKLVGSSTTKGWMKPTFRVSLTASHAGENSQINAPERTNVSSILTYLTFRRNQGRRTAQSGSTIELAKQQT